MIPTCQFVRHYYGIDDKAQHSLCDVLIYLSIDQWDFMFFLYYWEIEGEKTDKKERGTNRGKQKKYKTLEKRREIDIEIAERTKRYREKESDTHWISRAAWCEINETLSDWWIDLTCVFALTKLSVSLGWQPLLITLIFKTFATQSCLLRRHKPFKTGEFLHFLHAFLAQRCVQTRSLDGWDCGQGEGGRDGRW